MPEVLNARALGWFTTAAVLRSLDPETQAYVGRPTKLGNPYIINAHGSRAEVIDKYRTYVLGVGHPTLQLYLPTLRGKDLICWCAPLACHADVLLELANA